MHVGEISFCDKMSYNIKAEDTKRFILTNLEKKYKLKIIHKHYDKFEERTNKILNTNPHLVCVRSNGNPYFLYLMKYNFIQYCVFIDKKIQQGYYLPRMIIVHLRFDESMFNDTVFDGEMIKTNDGKWYFLINDLLVCQGNHLSDLNLPKRINMLYNVLDKHYIHDETDPFQIGVKSFFRYNEMRDMIQNHIPSLPYSVRGIYFKPLFMRFKDILYNFDDNLIKKVERVKYKNIKQFILHGDIDVDSQCSTPNTNLTTPPSSKGFSRYSSRELTKVSKKPNDSLLDSFSDISLEKYNNYNTPGSDRSSDRVSEKSDKSDIVINTSNFKINKFQVRKTSIPDVYEILKENSLVGTACIPTMKISKQMRELTKDMNMVDRIDIEFTFSTKFNKWIPLLCN